MDFSKSDRKTQVLIGQKNSKFVNPVDVIQLNIYQTEL